MPLRSPPSPRSHPLHPGWMQCSLGPGKQQGGYEPRSLVRVQQNRSQS